MPRHIALVVASHAAGDTGLVVELLSRDAGRVPCLARGARRSRERFPGGLDLLSLVEADTSPPTRGELHALHESRVVESWVPLRADALALGRGGYVVELAAALTPREHASPEMYDVAVKCLRALCAGPAGPAFLRAAEIRLLVLAGELPPTDHCTRCGTALGDAVFTAPGDPGHLACDNCREPGDVPLPRDEALLLRQAGSWTAEQARDAPVSAAASLSVGRWLAPVIRQAAGRTLRSARFLAQLQRAGHG